MHRTPKKSRVNVVEDFYWQWRYKKIQVIPFPMDGESIEFVLSSLPNGRTVFYDFPDRYAFMLLESMTKDNGTPVSELKKSRFGSLLQKPIVKEFFAKYGKSKITPSDFQVAWPAQPQAFRLTLGTWPSLERKPMKRWDQITK